MMLSPRFLATLLLLSSATLLLGAAPSPEVPLCRAWTGVRALLPQGMVEGVSVVVEGGKVVHAASGTPPFTVALGGGTATWLGKTCVLVRGEGLILTPGLLDPFSQLGTVEIDLENATRDGEVEGPSPIRAGARVWDAYNSWSALLPVTRMEGVTSALVAPSGGLISGQAAWVTLLGHRPEETVLRLPTALVGNLEALSSRMESLQRLREFLEDARAFARDRGAWERNQSRPFSASRLDLEAAQPLLRREIPLLMGADRASDLLALLALAKEQQIRLVIFGAAEGWMVREALVAAQVPVIVNPLIYGPGPFSALHARPDNPALLQAAGVSVMISPFGNHSARTLRQVAGNAVRGGMPYLAALQSLTEVPSRVFGLADRGRLVPGAAADLVLWNGDPLELSSYPVQLVMGGQEIPLESRQTRLREKYRTLPGTPLPPLP